MGKIGNDQKAGLGKWAKFDVRSVYIVTVQVSVMVCNYPVGESDEEVR